MKYLTHQPNQTDKSKRKHTKKELFNKRFATKTYIAVEEHQPEIGRFVICYSQDMETYFIAKFNPGSGWRDIDGSILINISHWCDDELFLPFEFKDRDRGYGFR